MADRKPSARRPGYLRGLFGLWIGLILALLVTSCSGISSGGGSCSASACDFVSVNGIGVAGCVAYEDRLYGTAGFTGRRFAPVRFAEVELRSATGTVIGNAHTDGGGAYCLAPALVPSGPVTVRVKSAALPPKSPTGGAGITVQDGRGASYFFESTPITPKRGGVVTMPTMEVLLADVQADRSRLLHRNQGGAFNILDVATGGFQFVHGVWKKPMPELLMTWFFDPSTGGTFFQHSSGSGANRRVDRINIKGLNTNDSDEYDDDIILHEFGHFALWVLSEDSSPGGNHFINGATQDTRLSWSEGWANFFSTMVRDVNARGFSNRSGLAATLIDAFALTEGSQQGALRFSYELTEPQAFVPDTRDPLNLPKAVASAVFRDLTKYSTSEVSVAVALWDIYKGGQSQSVSWPGIGVDGMLAVIRHIPEIRAPFNPKPVTFATFWQAYVDLFPANSDAVRQHFLADRLLTLIDDEWGADDTVAQVALLPNASDRHQFNALLPTGTRSFKAHTLFPEGDADLFLLDVTVPGTYTISTETLNDGADTFLEVLQVDSNSGGLTPVLQPNGSPASNDNYIPYVIRVALTANDGTVEVKQKQWLNYNGTCGPQLFRFINFGNTFRSNCPPNAANPPPPPVRAIPEYLASRVVVTLPVGTYYARVSRAPGAPPSTGRYGGYDIRVSGSP